MKVGRLLVAVVTALALFISGIAGIAETATDEAQAAQQTEAKDSAKAEEAKVGQVTKIDAGTMELLLGELSQGGGPGGRPGDGQGTPPQMPGNGGNGGNGKGGPDNSRGMPPQMPGKGNSDNSSGKGGSGSDNSQDGTSGATPQVPGGMGGASTFEAGEETLTVALTDATKILIEESNKTTEGTAADIAVGAIVSVLYAADGSVESVTILKDVQTRADMGTPTGGSQGFGGPEEVTNGTSANTISEDASVSGETYTSTGDDENALRIDGATVELAGITVEKSAGETSSTEDGDFYGQNAGLLALNGAQVTITGATVTTSAQNGNGVFSYGDGTVVTISDSRITTTGDNSGGIQTTGGGATYANNLTVETSGNSSAAIRSDRGGGTVVVDGGSYTSNGTGSPAIYSTADITVKNAALAATNSEAVVVEGKNSVSLENCDLTGNMAGTYKDGTENIHNVMLYQSMSGDADVGTASLSMAGGTLTALAGDMFYVTNTNCEIALSNVQLALANGKLLTVEGNQSSRGWGTAGDNGGNLTFSADNQVLEGAVTVDTISTLKFSLADGSAFTGTINVVENAAGGTASENSAAVSIGAGCTWTLTGDSTVSTLENSGTIQFNGYTVTLADGTVLSE